MACRSSPTSYQTHTLGSECGVLTTGPREFPIFSYFYLVFEYFFKLKKIICNQSNFISPLKKSISVFNKFILFTYLFLAALGLCCCARAFSSCSERGLLLVAVRGLLIAVASLVAEHGL